MAKKENQRRKSEDRKNDETTAQKQCCHQVAKMISAELKK